MKKLMDTINFYYKKLVHVVDVTLDNIVKTVEVCLSKVPKAIEDCYNILIANLNVNTVVVLGLAYIIYKNAAVIMADPTKLVIVLVALVLILKK